LDGADEDALRPRNAHALRLAQAVPGVPREKRVDDIEKQQAKASPTP